MIGFGETSDAPVIGPTDRLGAIGMTGSGKSEVIKALCVPYEGQLVIWDNKGSVRWKGPHANCYTPADVRRELQRSRVIRYRPRKMRDDDEMDAVIAEFWQYRGVRFWLEEAIISTSSNGIPEQLEALLVQGRDPWGHSVFWGAQKPTHYHPMLRDQADHMLVFARTYTPRSLANLAEHMCFDSPRELAETLQAVNAHYTAELGHTTMPDGKVVEMGRFAFIHYETASGKWWVRPPIPEHMRNARPFDYVPGEPLT